MTRPLLSLLLLAACTRPPSVAAPAADPGSDSVTDSATDPDPESESDSDSGSDPDPDSGSAAARLDPDGDDDPSDPGAGAIPAHARFERVGRAPLALTRICDLTPFGGALFAAHANQPLGTDGATITRYDPRDAKRPFTVAFDWNRPGEPTRGGGAGQGFVRVHAMGGRLFVPDADPPYDGFHLVDPGTEGYVFVSDASGRFAPPRAPHFRPPASPDADGKAGAAILPRAYHVLDAIRFRGRYYASTGAVPPNERAWHGPSPGALHVASADLAKWTYAIDYPFPWQDGVWRLGFMVRFKDRLYAGIQDYDAREPNDYVMFDPPAGSNAITRADEHAVRVVGTAQTLRWYADVPPPGSARAPRLFWIAAARDGVRLRVTEDGDTWTEVPLPPDAGRPTDVTRWRDGLVVLTERALLRVAEDTMQISQIAALPAKRSPFELGDIFCAAPLAVLDGELYAGGQRDGALYRVIPDGNDGG